jgi:hypothetical protein
MDQQSTSRTGKCDRCGAGADDDLRVVVFRGRVRRAERTLCDACAEELFEAFLDTPLDAETRLEPRRA